MKVLHFIIYFIFSISVLQAAENNSIFPLSLLDNEGNTTKITLSSYYNNEGTLEVRIDAAGLPKFLNKLNPTIAYGRDLDDNGKIDTWFFITKIGVETVEREGNDKYGIDILSELLLTKFKTSPLLYLSSATTTVLSYLLFTVSDFKEESNRFYLDWINLEDLQLRLEKEKINPESTLNRAQIQAQYDLISYGFYQLTQQMQHLYKKGIYESMAIDLGLWLSGGVIIKWGGRLLARPLKFLSESSFIKYLDKHLVLFFKNQQINLLKRFKQLKELGHSKKIKIANIELGIRLTALSWRQDVSMSVRAYIAKRKILRFSKGVFDGARSEWRYIALNIGIQSTAEAYTHFKDIKDPDPKVMAERLFSDPSVQQNIGFMTLDTVLMTGVSRNLKTPKARFMACGLIALHDSSQINFVIKQDDDYKRIAFDTSWEMVIGNAQVQADLAALSFFEKLALKNKNPKIKLLGYAFAILDQTAGYIGYALSAEKIGRSSDKSKDKEPILVPILVED